MRPGRSIRANLMAISCLCISVFIVYAVFKSPSSDNNLYGPYEVIRVIDGDTIVVNIDHTHTTIRLIGIDTPESVNPDESLNCEAGEAASEFTRTLLNEQTVYLEYDQERYDPYDRTLAYVYLEDGRMVNEILIQEGYADAMIIKPNIRHRDLFEE